MDSIFIIIIIVGIFGGFFIGGYMGFLIGKKNKKLVESTSVPPFVGNANIPGKPIPEFSREGYRSLAHLWRKKDNTGLALEMDGVMFSDRKSLSDETIHRLEGIGREWMAWLGVNEKAAPQSAATPILQNQIPAQPVGNFQKEKASSYVPVQPMAFVDTGSKKIEPAQKVFKAGTIAEQIDLILQEKIVEAGLTSKGIRITEDSNHSVIFHVGLKSYNGIDQVEDPEALLMIRSAVAEWEKRTTNLHRR